MRLFVTILLILTIAICSCGKNGTEQLPDAPAPGVATLLSPANKSACATGIPDGDQRQKVSFEWQAAANTESYEVIVVNTATNHAEHFGSTANKIDISLAINQAYSWSVISKSSKTSKQAQSGSWLFYLAGTPMTNYAPFPATAISPLPNSVLSSNGASSVNVMLQWSGSDVDNDISSYAVYLDDKDATTNIVASQIDTTITRPLAKGKTWFWKIITTDKANNSSASPVFQFMIQ